MKTKIMYSCLGVLLISVISLSIYIAVHKSICDRIHLDDNMKLWGSEDIVPNEETAKMIADIIIGSKSWFTEGENYNVSIDFIEEQYEWEIYYRPIPPEGYEILGGVILIYIKKDSGMITGLGILP